MALAKSQRSLKAWGKQNWKTKSGKKSSQRLGKDICQRKLLRIYHLQNMRQQQKQNDKEQKRENSLLNNQRTLQKK